MLHLLRECADFGGPELRLLALEFPFGGTVAIPFFRHGFGGGTLFVFLILQAAQKGRGDCFLLAHFRGGGLALRLSLLGGLRQRGLATEEIDQKQGSNLSED